MKILAEGRWAIYINAINSRNKRNVSKLKRSLLFPFKKHQGILIC